MVNGRSPSDQTGRVDLPAQIDVRDLRVAQDLVKAFFFADAALLPTAIGRADVAAAELIQTPPACLSDKLTQPL
jgi:hypothetical protein